MTNPYILKDYAIAICILWVLVTLCSAFIIIITGNGLFVHSIGVAISFSCWISFIAIVALVVTASLFGNHYIVLYTIDDTEIYSEVFRGRLLLFTRALHSKAFEIQAPKYQGKSVVKKIQWNESIRYTYNNSFRIITVRAAAGARIRLYCPDIKSYMQAVACFQSFKKE